MRFRFLHLFLGVEANLKKERKIFNRINLKELKTYVSASLHGRRKKKKIETNQSKEAEKSRKH